MDGSNGATPHLRRAAVRVITDARRAWVRTASCMASIRPLRGRSPGRILPRTRFAFPGWGPLLVQVALIVSAALCYFGVRGLTQSDLAGAQANARELMGVERALGLDWESATHALVIGHDHLVALVNWVYMYGHWPVIAATLIWLFLRAPDRFVLLRNAMFISGAIGLVVFLLGCGGGNAISYGGGIDESMLPACVG